MILLALARNIVDLGSCMDLANVSKIMDLEICKGIQNP